MVYISVPWDSRWVAKECLKEWRPRPRVIPAFFLPFEKFDWHRWNRDVFFD